MRRIEGEKMAGDFLSFLALYCVLCVSMSLMTIPIYSWNPEPDTVVRSVDRLTNADSAMNISVRFDYINIKIQIICITVTNGRPDGCPFDDIQNFSLMIQRIVNHGQTVVRTVGRAPVDRTVVLCITLFHTWNFSRVPWNFLLPDVRTDDRSCIKNYI